MIKGLNPSQRFWELFALVFLASTGAFMAAAWPQREPGIVADLRSPDCTVWREIPEGEFPDEYPVSTEQYYSLRWFLYRQHVTVRSEDEYDGYLARERARTALNSLAVWAGFSAGIYLLGWSSGWVTRALLKRRKRKAV